MHSRRILVLTLGLTLAHAAALAQRPDLLVADFEGTQYGAWTVTARRSARAPLPETLPNQMPVDGYQGRRLVNSFYGGDRSTGTLRSPP